MLFFIYFLSILCSSALFALGIPNELVNFGFAPAGFAGIVFLYYTLLCSAKIEHDDRIWLKKIILTSSLYGLFVSSLHVLSSFWLAFFEDFAIFTLGASTITYFFLAMPFGVVFHYVLKKTKQFRIFAFAAVWLLWEYFKSNDFLAYPWGTSPMICFNLKTFIQFTDTTGVWGLSFVVPLIAGCFGEILYAYSFSHSMDQFLTRVSQFKKTFAFTAMLIILLNIYGIIVLNKNVKPKTFLNTLIVQQNSDPWDSSFFEENLKKSQDITLESIKSFKEKTQKKVDLIVWSENSLPYSYIDEPNNYIYNIVPTTMPFNEFLKEANTPILVGTSHTNSDNKNFNSACVILPDGTIDGFYSKIQLVAFAEYMPFSDNPIVAKFFGKVIGFSSGYTPGKEYKLFSIQDSDSKHVKFVAPICFEDAFPRVCNQLHNLGSELLVNMSNDSWSKTASAEYQHFVISAYRAIELRSSFIRSTNSGFSVIVNPFGSIIDSMPLFTPKALVAQVPIYTHTITPFARFGDWFPVSILFILIYYVILSKINMIKCNAATVIPSCHWEGNDCYLLKLKRRAKMIRHYKPIFSVKRIKKIH